MRDLFYGFIRNYSTFGLRPRSKYTKWTHEILGFYAQLGKMIGCYIEYEWKRFDLVWFWSLADRDAKKPWLHVEHENNPWRLDKLLGKVKETLSNNIILIGYPDTRTDWNRFARKLGTVSVRKGRRVEILAILDGIFLKEETDHITGYIFSGFKEPSDTLEAKRSITEDSIYYAELIYSE